MGDLSLPEADHRVQGQRAMAVQLRLAPGTLLQDLHDKPFVNTDVLGLATSADHDGAGWPRRWLRGPSIPRSFVFFGHIHQQHQQ